MNSNTRKLHKGAAKKQHKKEKKQLEQTLISRFMETVKSLGHNAESIGEDVARASKRMAKKLARTFAKTKKTSKPLGLPADKNLSKTLKKGAKSVPAISSIGVAPIASEEKVKAAIGADKAGAKRKAARDLAKGTTKAAAGGKSPDKAVASSKTAKAPAKATAPGLTKGTTKAAAGGKSPDKAAASSKTAKVPAKTTAPDLAKGTTKTAAGSKSPDKMPLNVDKKSSRQAKAASKPATSAASDTRPVSDTVKSNKGRKVAASSKALAEKKIAAAELNKKHNN